MPSLTRGEVEVELDGKPYTLVYDFQAIANIETVLNNSVDRLFFGGSVAVRAMIEAIRFGMVRKHRRHTPEQVAALLDKTAASSPVAYPNIIRLVTLALRAAQGESQERLDEVNRETIALLRATYPGHEFKGSEDTPGPTEPSGATGTG